MLQMYGALKVSPLSYEMQRKLLDCTIKKFLECCLLEISVIFYINGNKEFASNFKNLRKKITQELLRGK